MSGYVMSPAPHLHSGTSTRQIMLDVLIALLVPAAGAAVWLFGVRAALVMAVCVVSCVATELAGCVLRRRPLSAGDLSCAVTGLLLAYNLPVTIPLWQAALGGVFAIGIVKLLFGGIGRNFVNPALAGCAVLRVSFPLEMTRWVLPIAAAGAGGAAATPLETLAAGQGFGYRFTDMLVGLHPGTLGATCAPALLIGGLYLLIRRVITPLIPLTFMGTVFVLGWWATGTPQAGVFHVLAGGTVLGGVFMATDYTTSPLNRRGQFLYALGGGALTMALRLWGDFPEGVAFAILTMNLAVPLIERAARALPFGTREARRLARAAVSAGAEGGHADG